MTPPLASLRVEFQSRRVVGELRKQRKCCDDTVIGL
jgi:hypothetical protein